VKDSAEKAAAARFAQHKHKKESTAVALGKGVGALH
jgi:hypothetical protein